ncbi:hypothetical protein [Phocaeicola plebeius]|uniref:hypothetical protein n=1 Tax=Phocaeicola plebeius TaxID=310297 RepID=UPI0026F321AC|nr:hypothetical protein [Phocaeicola plebeius]
MIAELIVSAVASVSLSTPKVVYNVSSDDKKVTNIEAYSVSDGKYLKRMYKINFIYNTEVKLPIRILISGMKEIPVIY